MSKQSHVQTISNRFDKLSKTKRTRLIVIVLLFVLLGVFLMVATRAAGPFVSTEPEHGMLSAGATEVDDTGASGGSAVRFTSGTAPGETSFTLGIIPDTQVEVSSSGAVVRYNNRIDWIIANKTSQNIKYVWQVGDLQDWDDATHSHYVRASAGLTRLEQAGVPYALTVGNHDTAAVCTGGSACPGVDVPTAFREIPTWNQYYPPSRYPGIITLCDEFNTYSTRLMAAGPTGTGLQTPTYVRNQCTAKNNTSNAYRKFTAGGLKWLLLNYEMWPRQVVQEWMKSVIERHTDHNIILFTHMHMSSGSTGLATDFGGYGSPQGSPKAVHDNVISKYSNVRIVSSGHTGTSGCAVFTGVNGNKYYGYLNNRHDGSPPPNHLRLLKINTATNTITSQQFVPQDGTTMTQQAECNATGVSWVR